MKKKAYSRHDMKPTEGNGYKQVKTSNISGPSSFETMHAAKQYETNRYASPKSPQTLELKKKIKDIIVKWNIGFVDVCRLQAFKRCDSWVQVEATLNGLVGRDLVLVYEHMQKLDRHKFVDSL